MTLRTPLFAAHHDAGARFTDFAGWEMPLSYSGVAEEHAAVRERCGCFDVSHMGEIEVRGPRALEVLQRLTVNDVSKLRVGDAQYTILCNDDGGVIDDLIVLRRGPERYLLIVNAANTPADFAWIAARAGERVEVVDRSLEFVLIALQGPEAEVVLRTLTPIDLAALRPFAFLEGPVAGLDTVVSRTGYTGEDGFELLASAADGPALWTAILQAVRRRGGLPAGLGARDTLRLEAGLPLCGTDMDTSTTPLEAGLGWVVKLGKGEFVGRKRMALQAAGDLRRRLVGIQLDEPGIPRHGYPVWREGAAIGSVTSGMKSATLGQFIGLAYVATGSDAPDTPIAVEIRGRRVPARVVPRPFYRRIRREG